MEEKLCQNMDMRYMLRIIPMLGRRRLVNGKERCESRSCLRSERVILHGREPDKGRFTACTHLDF